MRSLEEFTKRQKDKFLFAQIIINILDIYGFKYKIVDLDETFMNLPLVKS